MADEREEHESRLHESFDSLYERDQVKGRIDEAGRDAVERLRAGHGPVVCLHRRGAGGDRRHDTIVDPRPGLQRLDSLLQEPADHGLVSDDRLGITGRCYERNRSYRNREVRSFVVTVTGAENLRQFHEQVGARFLGAKKRAASRALAVQNAARMSRDVIPSEVSAAIRQAR